MTDLPPIEYLDEAAIVQNGRTWQGAVDWSGGPHSLTCTRIITHAHALHQLAQARAELAALKPRETLEDVARRTVKELITERQFISSCEMPMLAAFRMGVQMQRDGGLPDE